MKRVLLFLPTTSYRNEDFLAAARTLGVEIIAAANYCPELAPRWGMGPLLSVHFDRPHAAAERILAALDAAPDAVLAVEDQGLELASLVRERLALPGNPLSAVMASRDKLHFREMLRVNGFNCPGFQSLPDGVDARQNAQSLRYPVVVKARRLSASRGVIRADNAAEFVTAVNWARAIQNKADRDAGKLGLLVEDFVPGSEYALEGILENGGLRVLALFDKPDPLDGPYFEETIYVTPSRLPAQTQEAVAAAVERACCCLGLHTGPVHAEARVNAQGIWLLEVAARSIGGLCGRALRHSLGMSLEELILRHALGMEIPRTFGNQASGVMMIPIPRRGIYLGVRNIEAALARACVTDVRITAEPGHIVAPAPEGASYLGFIFARGEKPQEVEMALRQSHRLLQFDLQPEVALNIN